MWQYNSPLFFFNSWATAALALLTPVPHDCPCPTHEATTKTTRELYRVFIMPCRERRSECETRWGRRKARGGGCKPTQRTPCVCAERAFHSISLSLFRETRAAPFFSGTQETWEGPRVQKQRGMGMQQARRSGLQSFSLSRLVDEYRHTSSNLVGPSGTLRWLSQRCDMDGAGRVCGPSVAVRGCDRCPLDALETAT